MKVRREAEGDKGRQETVDLLYLTRLSLIYLLLSRSRTASVCLVCA